MREPPARTPAERHAQVLGLRDDPDSLGAEGVVQPVRHLLGEPLLALQLAANSSTIRSDQEVGHSTLDGREVDRAAAPDDPQRRRWCDRGIEVLGPLGDGHSAISSEALDVAAATF